MSSFSLTIRRNRMILKVERDIIAISIINMRGPLTVHWIIYRHFEVNIFAAAAYNVYEITAIPAIIVNKRFTLLITATHLHCQRDVKKSVLDGSDISSGGIYMK